MTKPTKLTEILATCKAHSTPNKWIREYNKEYWYSIEEAERAILAWVNEVIGEDSPNTNYDEDVAQNELRAEQRRRAGI